MDWLGERGVSIVGFDFYHGNGPRDADPAYSTSRHCAEASVLTMPDIRNLGAIAQRRFTLIDKEIQGTLTPARGRRPGRV